MIVDARLNVYAILVREGKPNTDVVRGFVFDLATGRLNEVN
jgi:hypothetical protein